jgi:DNA-binding response OmpR family regulator
MALKILVVDDDTGTLTFLEHVLRKQGYDVVTAVDGLDALVKVKNETPDLVVLDVMMPEINGYDVCFHMRFNKDFERIPILLTTAREQELDPVIGERVNIDYIQKPVDTAAFLAKVAGLAGAP